MTRYRIRIFTVIAIAWLCAGSLPAEIIVPEGVEIRETDIYISKVENLRIREAPNLNSKVMGSLKCLEEVESLGISSSESDTLIIDGIKITAKWLKIKNNRNVIGWVWEGFIVRVSIVYDKYEHLEFKLPIDIGIRNYNKGNLNYKTSESIIIDVFIENAAEDTFNKKANDYVYSRNYYIDNNIVTENVYLGTDPEVRNFQKSLEIKKFNRLITIVLIGEKDQITLDSLEYFIKNRISLNDFTEIISKADKTDKDFLSSSYKKKGNHYLLDEEDISISKVKLIGNILKRYITKKQTTGFEWYLSKQNDQKAIFLKNLRNKQLTYRTQYWHDISDFIIASIKVK